MPRRWWKSSRTMRVPRWGASTAPSTCPGRSSSGRSRRLTASSRHGGGSLVLVNATCRRAAPNKRQGIELWKIELLRFCTATFRKSLAKVTRPAAAPPFRTSILKTACCTSRPVFLLDTTLWTSSPETCARHIHTSSIRPHGEPQALHNGGILAWGSGPKGEAPDYTGLDVVIVRDGKIAALYGFLNPKFK